MIRTVLLTGLCMLITACVTTQPQIHRHDEAILDNLRSGGYVIFFMHAAADRTSTDASSDLEVCADQPRLNGLGKTQAKVIGKSMRKLEIPVGEVYASQYCHCLNTARLAFGRATASLDITHSRKAQEAERQRRIQALTSMLASLPDKGTNTVIVGHAAMLKAAQHINLQAGEAAIFKPDGKGATVFVSQVKPNGWQTLVSRISDEEQ